MGDNRQCPASILQANTLWTPPWRWASLCASGRNKVEISTMMKRLIIALFAATVMAMTVTGCNTMRGAGEDIENTGEAIQDNL